MKEINHSDYHVHYDPDTAIITCSGSFRLRGPEYEPIMELLSEAASTESPTLTLDVRELKFLNSSGINTLSKFVLLLRERDDTTVTVLGTNAHPWQRRSLINLQRLLPSLQLTLE